ncbi:diguanylate cyclase [Thalassotalea fusca]
MTDISELSLKRLLEHAHIGVVIHRWDTSIVYANPTALRLLRLTYDQIIGTDAFDPLWCFVDESGKKMPTEEFPVNKVIKSRQRLNNEVLGVIDSSREEISWFMINAYYEGTPSKDNSFIVVTFNDISDSKKLFSFQDIVENTQDIVIVTEAEDIDYPTGPKIVYVNQSFVDLTGYSPKEVIGETPRILQGALTDNESKARIQSALEKRYPVSETILNYDINGRPYWIDMNIIPLKNKYGEVTHFAAIERDVTELKFHLEQLEKRNQDLRALKQSLEERVEKRTLELQLAKAQLEKIAYFDPLTNIPNRRFFIDQANKLIKSCNRHKQPMAFGLLDVDDFKEFNDSYGHDLGDVVLQEIGNCLNELYREDDAFCRYGGEEFAFVIAINQETDAHTFAKRLLSKIRDIRIEQSDMPLIKVTVSLGISICQPHAKADLEQQIKLADQAMYDAKNKGKDQYIVASE